MKNNVEIMKMRIASDDFVQVKSINKLRIIPMAL